MEWSILKNRYDFNRAFERIQVLATIPNLEKDATLLREFELLALLIEHYEKQTLPPIKSDPIRQIKFAMEQGNLTKKDMTKYLGSLSKVSEVLNYKRPLTLTMIRKLHNGLGIPYDLLVEPYSLTQQTAKYDTIYLTVS